ncbi:MAG: hypothetical protein ABGX82_08420 [Pseudomonas sp.]|uniref:hypothetical protein n=1 Tax=Pseudomonas sp. TaxID=306 RepID=UPI0032421DF7
MNAILYEPQLFNFIEPVRSLMPIRFRVLVDGEASSSVKQVRIMEGSAIAERGVVVAIRAREFTPELRLYDRLWLRRASWLVVVEDRAAEPPIYKGVFLPITASGTYTINIWTGAGGSVGGDDAMLPALVRVDGLPDDRDVVALERTTEGEWRVAGFARAAAGGSVVSLKVLGGQVYGMAVDDYGIAFLPGLAVTVGQRIRPSVFRGWLYDVTETGTLPEAEPAWWPIEGDNPPRLVGTARLQAVRYYRPLAHGPITVEIT